ncbi:MAG: pyridoxal phosphate-dependent aminotransferase [Candidatus Njordarchaeales archaeon]
MKLLLKPEFDLFVDRITAKAKEVKNIIQLQWGELAVKPPLDIIKFFKESYDHGYVRYTTPHGDNSLRQVLVDKLKRKNNVNADIENILVTVGGTAAINFAFRVVAGDGGYILTQDPAWFGYSGIAHIAGAKTIKAKESEYSYELFEKIYKKLKEENKELRVIVLNYPANPTGHIFDVHTLKEALDFSEDYDVLLLSDEAYEDFVFKGKHVSLGSLRGLDKVVSIYTFSKTYAFTGLRIGYAVGNKDLINAMAVAQVHTYISPPSINQYVARRILEEELEEPFVKKNLKILQKNLKLVMDYVEDHAWEMIEPKGGIYAFIRLPGVDSGNFSLKLLEKMNVAVAPGIDFGENWKDWLRITIARTEEEIQEGLDRISKLYSENSIKN